MKSAIYLSAFAALALSACGAHKVVTVPAKAIYKTGEVGVKGVYYTGKGVYYTGKGAYVVGKTTVDVYDGVVNRAEQLVRITAQVVGIAGNVVEITDVVALKRVDGWVDDLSDYGEVVEVVVEEVGDMIDKDDVKKAAAPEATPDAP